MTKARVTCTYCAKEWFLEVVSKRQLANLECTKCKDKHPVVKEYESVDYYQGAPPFPDKSKEDFDLWYLNNHGLD